MTFFGKIAVIALLIILFKPLDLAAQRSRYAPRQTAIEQLPMIAIDTIESPLDENSSIILYSNGTWKHLHHDIDVIMQNPVYSNNWDTTQIFSYKSIKLSHLPAVVELTLIDDLDGFCAPTVGKVFSKYGIRRRANHNGIDIPKPKGEPLYAIFDGVIRYSQYNTGGYGYLTIIRHPNGLESWYAHLCKINNKIGDYVKAGEVIGYIGNTGRSRGSHLHFELRYCDQSFDPEFLIDFETGRLKYQTFALEKSFFNIRSRASELLEEEEEEYFTNEAQYAQATDSVAISKLASSSNKAAISQTGSGTALYHTVKSGDILGRISARYGISIDRLCKLNGISRTTTLRINQRLRVR